MQQIFIIDNENLLTQYQKEILNETKHIIKVGINQYNDKIKYNYIYCSDLDYLTEYISKKEQYKHVTFLFDEDALNTKLKLRGFNRRTVNKFQALHNCVPNIPNSIEDIAQSFGNQRFYIISNQDVTNTCLEIDEKSMTFLNFKASLISQQKQTEINTPLIIPDVTKSIKQYFQQTYKIKKDVKLSIIIPTLLMVDLKFLQKSIAQCTSSAAIDEIIIIDNTSTKRTRQVKFLQHKKIKLITDMPNLYVNPAWNYGASIAKNDYLIFMNDDVLCMTYTFNTLIKLIQDTNVGLITVNTLGGDRPAYEHNFETVDHFIRKHRTPVKNHTLIEFNHDITGWFFAVKRQQWSYIPSNLFVYCGDNYVYDCIKQDKLKVLKLQSHYIYHFHKGSNTIQQLGDNNPHKGLNEMKKYKKVNMKHEQNKIILSVLICTLTERKKQLNCLLQKLQQQTCKNVEILIELDNRELTTGAKRNKLIQKAKGDYIVFIDDDDMIAEDYIAKILYAITKSYPDAVGFKSIISFDGQNDSLVDISMKYKTWYDEPDPNNPGRKIYYRGIEHLNPVKREIALKVMFPNITIGEDAQYSRGIMQYIQTEEYIDSVLYYYQYISNK